MAADPVVSPGHDRRVLLAATVEDRSFLDQMLTEAAFPGAVPRPTDPRADDHIARYLDGWGRPGDQGLVAWDGRRRVGAAWVRLLAPDRPGYGFVDAATPELTVAVAASHRGRGIGRALVTGVLDQAAASGQPQVSLSVAGANPVAAALYRSLGFVAVGAEGGSTTMLAPSGPEEPNLGWVATAREATVADGPALLRLRERMFCSMGRGGDVEWQAPFLRTWAEGAAAGSLLGAIVDGGRGRPIASAVAMLQHVMPGVGRLDGRDAVIGLVATEPAWRRRGAAGAAIVHLQSVLVAAGFRRAHLRATSDGEGVYRRLGFVRQPEPTLRWEATGD